SDGAGRQRFVGDYRVQWGQGFGAWGGFASGKSDMTVGNEKSGKGFTPYTSTDENNYLRGAALSVGCLENLTVDLFVSRKKTDGNVVRADTLSEEDYLSVTLFESGYHRNLLDSMKHNTWKERSAGISARWNTRAFRTGWNVLYYDFSPALIPGDRIYQQYNDSGSGRWLVSWDYKTSWRGFYLFGETARSNDGVWATVDGVRTHLSWMSACVLYRRYDKRYVSHYASGFGEYSNSSNEEGVYCGVDLSPLKNLKLNLYYDWFHFFSPRYGATLPGAGWEILVQAAYRYRQFEHTLRCKHEVRPEDAKKGGTVDREKSEFRYQLAYMPGKQVELRTRFTLSHYRKASVKERGYMLYQDVIYAPRKINLKMQCRLAWFQTDSYNSRIYAYENNVLYGYSFPAFMGKGFRTYLNLNWRPVKKLTCYLKTGWVIYPGLDSVSSGLTRTEGNRLYDITLQLRCVI
ncbi:MAG: helix-hairpin-helix domain-containing protein, partial [Odoribacter sp.]|nr:helix-hairpin-helix domain-containing protein [Odoribacter sp.]